METTIKNFKTGFALAILITCVQAYAIYTYGFAITDGHPIGYTLLYSVMFFLGWFMLGSVVTGFVRLIVSLVSMLLTR